MEANIPELARLESLQAGKAVSFANMELMNPPEAFRCIVHEEGVNDRLCRIH
jgi:hypothetical protein